MTKWSPQRSLSGRPADSMLGAASLRAITKAAGHCRALEGTGGQWMALSGYWQALAGS